jgi:hypothetical protein
MRRWGIRVIVGSSFFVVGLAGVETSLAAAQAGDATIVVEQSKPLLAAYEYVVRVTTADGAPVNGAPVTATPVGPDGKIGSMFSLAPFDSDGRYQAIVEMPAPGTWTVRFAVADPVGNLEHVQEMGDPAAIALPSPVTVPEAPTGDPGAAPSSTEATPDDANAEAAEAPAAGASDEASTDDESSSKTPLLAAAALLAATAAATAMVATRRKKKPPQPGANLDPLAKTDDPADAKV